MHRFTPIRRQAESRVGCQVPSSIALRLIGLRHVLTELEAGTASAAGGQGPDTCLHSPTLLGLQRSAAIPAFHVGPADSAPVLMGAEQALFIAETSPQPSSFSVCIEEFFC